jgi:glycogen(starch) synthase
MTRIVHLSKRYAGSPGGDAAVVGNLAVYQRAQGDEVTILTSNCAAIAAGEGVQKFGLRIAERDIDQINVRRVISLIGLAIRSFVRLRRTRPDVIHAHAVDMGAAVSLAARLLGVPLVLTLHGTSIGSPALSLAKQRLERWLVRAARYDAIFSVTPDAVPLLRGLGKRDAEYLPNAVDLEAFPVRDYPAPGAPLLFVGRLEAVKGVDVLLRALAEARCGDSALQLRIAGGGSLEPALRALADELGLGSATKFLGKQSSQQVAQELRGCSALVLPSLYEGFPIVLLEAWASGRPVVSTAVGAIPDVCTDGVDSLLVPVSDPKALAAALVRLAQDGGFARELGAAGRRNVEANYTPDTVGRVVERVYAEVRGLPVPAATSA